MYPITNAVKALFEAEQTKVLRITGTDKNGAVISITDDDVLENSFEIDRYSCNGQMLEIGTAISAQLSMKLENTDGRYDSIVFEGAELFVEIGIADWTQANPTITWVPCGYFTPDIQPRKMTTISITALDRMMWFENVSVLLHPWTTQSGEIIRDSAGEPIYFVSNASLVFPCTVAELVGRVCALCNVPFSQNLAGLPNYNYSISELLVTDQSVTFRDVIKWCAGIMGTNAWIDWSGSLRFSWYNNDTGYVSTVDNRLSSDLYENAIVITGVKCTLTDDESTMYIAGSNDYAIDLTGNNLINADNVQTLLQSVYNALNAFAYTPFSANVIAAPYLWPMDRMVFTDKNGNGHVSALTNVNLSLNGSTALSAVGESLKAYSYGTPGSFTLQQQAAMQKWRSNVVADTRAAVDNASAQITGANGGYVRFMYDENGMMTEILIMDTTDIATATKVWRWNQGGFGYSSNGYQGPFTTAITQDGAIVADFITVGALNASLITTGVLNASLITTGTLIANIIKAGSLSDESGKNFWNMETGEFSLAAATTVGGSTVDSIAQNKANSAVSTFDNSLNQQSVFDRLTNNGQTQGIYLKDGKLYINATYIDTGTLIANIIKGGTLTLGGNNNVNGTLIVKDASGNIIGTWDNNGLVLNKGSISGPSITIGGSNNVNGLLNVLDSNGNTVGKWDNNYFEVDTGNLNIDSSGNLQLSENRPWSQYEWWRRIEVNPQYLNFYMFHGPTEDEYIRAYIRILLLSTSTSGSQPYFQVSCGGLYFEDQVSSQRIIQGSYSDIYSNYRFIISSRLDIYGYVQIYDNLTVTGTKSRVVNTDQYSDRLLYCYETPSPLFGDVGEGVIGEDGYCYIMLDAIFAKTITTDQYQVFLQKYGDGDCWVQERKGAYFIVKGTPGLSFGWELKAKQRDYDQRRLDRNDDEFTVPTQTYGEDAAKHIDEIRKEREAA